MKVLDAEETNRATTLAQQRNTLSFQTAQNDIKNLTSRLADYQKYYDSLKAMMDKNTADEKKHQDDLKAIQQQRLDNQKTTADLITKITGTDKSLTTQQQYESGRSSLNQQFMDITNTLAGQDQIKALNDYKQAVAALQAQFAQGTSGTSASKVAEDALTDINRAAQMQENTLSALADQMQKQVEADKIWGITLQGEAEKSANSILEIQNVIADLTAKMKEIPKEINIRGVDSTSAIIDSIAAGLRQLHELAVIPITIQQAGGEGSMNLPTQPILGSFASGTPYVPRTGYYKLHEGESVTPAQNNNSRSTTIGDIHIHIPSNAAPQRPEDYRVIVRNHIIPELRKAGIVH
jgi:hypothetical protein